MESMLVVLERDYAARKQGVHLREEISVIPNLYRFELFCLIHKQQKKQ